MPTLSKFYGMHIRMHYNDHAPPHFHAVYGDCDAMVNIRTLEAMKVGGTKPLPPRALRMVIRWARQYQNQLMEAWKSCERGQDPGKIFPLT